MLYYIQAHIPFNVANIYVDNMFSKKKTILVLASDKIMQTDSSVAERIRALFEFQDYNL